MLGLLLLAFLVVPLLELYVFVQVADAIGFLATLGWIVAVSVVGAWLVKREGLGALRRANEQAARGEIPTNELANGILILVGGALMLTPGFFTDAFGLALIAPPTRALLRGRVKRRFSAHGPVLASRSTIIGGFGPGAGRRQPSSGEVWDAQSWEEEPPGSDRPGLR